MKRFISENINGILGTTIFHLLLIMLLLFVKIGKIREFHKEQMLLEFIDEMQTIEEILQASGEFENIEMPSLDQRTIQSIAQNVSSQLEQEISTDQYEKQIMEELGIESLKPDVPELNDESPMLMEKQEIINDPSPDEIKNTISNENTVVTYDLENRWHKYIYIPAYKCEGGGTVVLSFEVNQNGSVTKVNIMNEISTSDPCLLDEAVNSARKALFNSSSVAPTIQYGTITYVFIPQ
ncbi:MAG: energy transducer TonB [Bacteroidales bacterium]|nr:energy transducer TonB [Bacteroidales bacterium]